MNSKRIPPFPLSTSAAGPPQPPSFPLPIRAPLSPLEESSSTASTSSDSEIETVDDDVLNGSGSENKSAPVLVRSESMPVARLTEDEDVDVEEDEEVSDDSDGFVVRVPVINDVGGSGDANPDPSSDDDGEDNVDLEESLDGVRALGEKSAKDFFDVEQFSDIGGVSSKDAEHSLDRRHSFDGDEGRVADDGKLDSVKNANETRVLSENLNRDVFDEFDGNALSDVYRASSYDGNPCSKPKHSPGSDNEGNENLLELGALGENTNVEDFIKNSDEIENFNCKDMQIGAAEMGGYDDFIADSNENQKMEDEDCSVPVDYGKIDSSPYKFDEGGDVKLSEGLNGVSTSLVEPDVLEISFDNNGAIIETQNSVKDEEAVTRLEHASIVSEAKLKSAENDSLLDANSKTGECEKEIEEIHEAEGVESMDEKAKVVEERHASDEQMIKNSEGEAVNRLEHASIVSEAKLQSAKNDSLLDANSKTGECEKEIEEIHEDEAVESMDEKAKMVEERHASDGQMIKNSEGEAVTRLEHASIVSEAKLKSAENDSLLDAKSKTGECEKEIEEIHEDEGVGSMDEKAKVVEERHASDEQMIKNSEGLSSSRYYLLNIKGESGSDEEGRNELHDTLSLLEFLKAMTSSPTKDSEGEAVEHASIVSEAKLKSAENDSLLDANSKTGECGKEIEEIHEDEGVESMDEKAKVVEETHASDEQMIQNSEGPSSSRDYLLNIKGESGSDEEGRKELHETVSLLEFLKAMASSPTKDNTAITTSDASLGVQPLPTIITSPNNTSFIMPDNKMTEEEKKLHEQVESIRVKFLRIVHRLGHSSQVSMATLVLHHLARIEDLKDWKSCSQNARKKAHELEMEEKDKLDFSCNILVIGKAGVGKSATINSIFEEEKSLANPFRTETTSVRKIEGVVGGINIQILDTPGLGASIMDQASNIKILSSVKKHMKRCPPDVVLYVDRLDTHTQNFNDVPLLRSITQTLGLSIWSNAIIALTHATEDPPEGPSGSSLSYEAFVAQRSHVVLQSLRKATGDMGLINPVALVENDQSCRWNREGQKLLPNGSIWRSELLLHCCSLKILSEAFSLPKVRESSVQKLLRSCFRSPPMHFFLSSLLQSKDHPKLPLGLGGNEDSDIDLDDFSDDEEEDEYDQLPPFYPLSKSQIAELSKEHRRAYFAEYDYRVKLLQRKQLKDAIKELKEIKKRARSSQVASSYDDIYEESDDGPTAVVNPAPDIVLPPSFDCDNPVYRYRSLEPTSHPLTGFVLDGLVWDHDCGFDGVRLEHLLAIASRFPAEVSVRLRKDKNDFTINFDSSISAKHGQNGSSLASFDIRTVGDLLSYCLRGETKFKNFKNNKTTVGFSANRLGDTWAAGLKLDDEVSIGKRVNLTAKTGAVLAEGDVAYGTNLEATLMKTCHLIGQSLATVGLSLFRCNGYLVCGGTLQSEVEVCENSKMAVLVGLNSNKNGKITIRTSSREQVQVALLGLIPIVLSFFRKVWPGESL